MIKTENSIKNIWDKYWNKYSINIDESFGVNGNLLLSVSLTNRSYINISNRSQLTGDSVFRSF